jgi:uncharacterized protein YdeI (YjbR/CyaY-like superfamily)
MAAKKRKKKAARRGTVLPSVETVACGTVAQWTTWLRRNHATRAGVWLQLEHHARLDKETLNPARALDVALCFGWIDGQKKRLDARVWLVKFTPRPLRSTWSKDNQARAVQLQRLGRMQPAGRRAIQRAKDNGMWQRAYDGQHAAAMPADLKDALAANAAAAAHFATLDARNRYAIYFRLESVVLAATRQRRLVGLVAMLERGESIYP